MLFAVCIRQAGRIRRLIDERDRALVGYRATSRKLDAALADRDRWRTRATVLNDLRDPEKCRFVDEVLRTVAELGETT